jgi:Flp pilus assembly protein CpaB
VRQRPNLIVVLGLAVFVVGAAAAWLVLRDSSSSSAADATSVLVADKPIAAGTTGQAAVAQGLIKVKKVDMKTRPATALTDASQLAGKTAHVNIPAGTTLVAEQFDVAQTVVGTVNIPGGKEALAVQLTNVPGVAGFAGAGDKIDVYGIIKDPKTNTGIARRVMSGIEVLKVNGTTLVPTQGQPGGPGLVFLVAVTPEQAERLVYLTTLEQLYFALVPKANAPTAPTPGTNPQTVLNPV